MLFGPFVLKDDLSRYRYDQLMVLGWKTFLPISITCLIFTSAILISFNWLPF